MKQRRFAILKYGSSFATRERARLVIDDLAGLLHPSHDRVVIDFRGVSIVSYSFADEFLKQLGRLLKVSDSEAILLGCGDGVVAAFARTLEKRDRLNQHHLTASSSGDGLRILHAVALA